MVNKRYLQVLAGEERPFNMAVALLERCNLLFIKANEASVVGDYNIWYRVLKALTRTISFKLTKDEDKDLRNALNKFNSKIAMGADDALDKIETKIIGLMYQYGMYYPKYKDRKNWEEDAQEEDK